MTMKSPLEFSHVVVGANPCVRPDRHMGLSLRKGEGDGEGGAAAEFAVHFERAVVCGDDAVRDGEAQPGAALFARTSRIHRIKPLENMGQMLGGDAGTGVLDCHADTIGLGENARRD